MGITQSNLCCVYWVKINVRGDWQALRASMTQVTPSKAAHDILEMLEIGKVRIMAG